MASIRLILLLSFFMATCAALVPLSARADTLDDVTRLLNQGRPIPALKQLDNYLSSRPNDVQGRFLKGVILAETNNLGEAISIFTKLTEDHPELPEPYNNLAVIYARQQQYDKAKQALEKAIQTHPAYATAHRNLEDLYARLASQAYDKALQNDSLKGSAPVKLATIKELTSTSSVLAMARPPGKKPIEVASAEVKIAEPELVDPKQPATKPAEPTLSTGTVTPLDATPDVAILPEHLSAPVSAGHSAAESAPVEVKPSVPVTAKTSQPGAVSDVTKAVAGWLAAWSEKDVEAYLAHYAKDFVTPGGESRSAWEAERATRIKKPGAIQVSYENLQVSFDGGIATAKFRQHYKSARFKTGTSKVLVLVNRDGHWLIQQERIGN